MQYGPKGGIQKGRKIGQKASGVPEIGRIRFMNVPWEEL